MQERYVVDAHGKPVAVLLDIEDYHKLLQRVQLSNAAGVSEPSVLGDAEWQARWEQFLARARSGVNLPDEVLDREHIYDTRDVAD